MGNRSSPDALDETTRRSIFAGVLVGTTLSAASASADLMQACAQEVRAYCADVERGRDGISAYLASHEDKLDSACLPEVDAVGRSWLVPGDVGKIFNPDFRAELPPSCESAAAELCPNVERSDGRIFACIYAHTRKVGAACRADARAVVTAR